MLSLLPGILAAQTLLEQARAAQGRHHLDTAYTIIQQAAEAEPNNAVVQFWLGQIAGNRAEQIGGLRAYGAARACKRGYARAVQLEPTNPDYLEGLIGYLSQAPGIVGGDRDSAYVLAVALRRINEWRGINQMATVLWRGNAREKARADSIMDAWAQSHTDRVNQFRQLTYYSQTDRPERALAINERLLARDPNDVVAKFGVGRNLVVLRRDPQRALTLLRAVAALPRPTGDSLNPTYSPVGLPWRTGQAFIQLGQPDSARVYFQHALEVQPGFRGAQLSLDSLSHH